MSAEMQKYVVVAFIAAFFVAMLGVAIVYLIRRNRWNRPVPFCVNMTLSERMSDLGLRWIGTECYSTIPPEIRSAFIVFGNSDRAGCPKCHTHVNPMRSDHPQIHEGVLGWFCGECGYGQLIQTVNTSREAMGRYPLHQTNLFWILNALERQAMDAGLIVAPQPDEECAESDVRVIH